MWEKERKKEHINERKLVRNDAYFKNMAEEYRFEVPDDIPLKHVTSKKKSKIDPQEYFVKNILPDMTLPPHICCLNEDCGCADIALELDKHGLGVDSPEIVRLWTQLFHDHEGKMMDEIKKKYFKQEDQEEYKDKIHEVHCLFYNAIAGKIGAKRKRCRDEHTNLSKKKANVTSDDL